MRVRIRVRCRSLQKGVLTLVVLSHILGHELVKQRLGAVCVATLWKSGGAGVRHQPLPVLSARTGIARLQAQARWLYKPYPSAAASMCQGMEETFAASVLDLPPTLRWYLATTNLIESPNAGIRMRTGSVTRCRDGAMVLRCFAAGYLETGRRFLRIMGYECLWVLKAKLQKLRELRLEHLWSTSTVSVQGFVIVQM